jgi:hypothetical protein
MINPETKKILTEVKNTSYGQALRIWLNEAIIDIGDIKKVTSYEDAIGRQLAVKKLEEMFSLLKDEKIDTFKKTPYT